MALDPSGARLLVAATDNHLHLYDCSRPLGARTSPLRSWGGYGMLTGSFYGKACFSPDGRWVLTGSKDAHAYLWEADGDQGGARPPLRLAGHAGEVTAVAWNPTDADQVRPR
jgi:WD40 repeat protein